MTSRLFTFVGGETGIWRIVRMETITGEPLPSARRLNIMLGAITEESDTSRWLLRGIRSYERYVIRNEREQLEAKQPGLGRPEAICGALIPIRKNATWWDLSQDERRKVFEERSKHIEIGLQYLPAIARRLYHCRDLGENEPFDFLTWFEYAPANSTAFDKLVAKLRASQEWTYVDREIDIRLIRESA